MFVDAFRGYLHAELSPMITRWAFTSRTSVSALAFVFLNREAADHQLWLRELECT